MSPFRRPVARRLAAIRRVFARRPWLYWLLVAVIAAGFGLTQRSSGRAIEAERESWGESTEVLVAVDHHDPGDALLAEVRTIPAAVVPEGAIVVSAVADRASVARQRIGPGEIITADDLAPASGPLGLAPEGWVVVPVDESTASGAEIGDHVLVVGEGFVITDEAIVVGAHEDAVLLAVQIGDAAIVVAAADAVGVTLVRTP